MGGRSQSRTPIGTDSPILFVVDDEPDARKSAAALASSMGIACETFSSAESFLDSHDPSRAGCVLIDLCLGGMSGLELQEQLAARDSTLPVIIISAHVDVPTAVRLMRNGALTVLEKPYRADDLTEAIRMALETDQQRRRTRAQRMQVQQRIERLDPRERRTLELILAGQTNKLIADDLGVSRRTVDRLRASIYKKFGVETVVELARLVGRLRASGQTV